MVALGTAALLLIPGALLPSAAAKSRAAASAPVLDYFALTQKIRDPYWITPGPDGNLWFTNPGGDTIGRITPKGVITEFKLAKGTHPQTITAAADGNLWFTMRQLDRIGVMDTTGNLIHEYSVRLSGGSPYYIAPSPDGAVWFTDYAFDTADALDKVERMTLDGNSVTKYDLAQCGCGPYGVTYGPDGNMWFSEELGATPEMNGSAFGTVDRVSLDGKTVDRYPPSVDHSTMPAALSPGPDGNVWFTEIDADQHSIGRITPTGTITEFKIGENSMWTNGIVTGVNGDLWFTETSGSDSDIWRVHPNGALAGTSTPVHSGPIGITVGPDGNLWFAVRDDGEIGRLKTARGNRSYVLEIASGFTPAVRTAPLGRTVQWVLEAPGTNHVRDASGMSLFDSGPVPPVSFFTYRFTAAGTYPYRDSPSVRGRIAVPIDAPATGEVGTPVRLQWALSDAPDGKVFDVQVMRPGAHHFANFRTDTPGHGGNFNPSESGRYRFRARMHPPGETGTGWSPIRTIPVS
jgi:virginiamycin B lyase